MSERENPSEHAPVAPVLLISPNGMLGRAWRQLLDQQHIAYHAVSRPELDLANPASIAKAIPPEYRTVINCAAWTDVDGAESHEAQAQQVNALGPGALAAACRKTNATLVHYSTDYVFDGQASAPYPVDHPRDPVNAYGQTKAQGEQRIEASGCEHLIIRTSWLYAPWGNNFVRTMAKLTADRDTLRVVSDQHGRPTSCQHLAKVSLTLLEAQARGIYHVTDAGECTWHEFTCEIAKQLGNTCDVQPCTSAEFPRPARRPSYSVLDLSKTLAITGPLPHWRDNLAAVLAQLPAR